eukprot:NP_001265603.1 uncharacterized protein LOC643365 [Homo sapiens]
MAISWGLDASADCSLHASTSTPTLQGYVTDWNSYSDDTPEVNTTPAASWPLMGQVHVESRNFTAEPAKVLMACRSVSGSSGRKSFQAACEHSQKQLRIILLLLRAGVGPQAGGHVPGWQDLSTVKLDAPAGPVLPARIPLPQDALHTLRIPSRCSGACTEGLGPAPGNSKEANGFMSRFCQIASEAALFAVAAECRAGHLSGQSGAPLPCISWAMRGDLCPLHRSCVPCACDRVFPVYSVLLHVFQFRFVVCE